LGARPVLLEDVIDPVQTDKASKDQIDSHRKAHDPGASSRRNTTATTEAIRRGLGCGKVHPELTADSDAWAGAKVDVGHVAARRPPPQGAIATAPGATPRICRPATSCDGRL
jgi:hypothetical protein